jgi:hypothetical protein
VVFLSSHIVRRTLFWHDVSFFPLHFFLFECNYTRTRNPLKQSSNSLLALAASKANRNVGDTDGRENERGIHSGLRDNSTSRRRSPETSCGASGEGGFLDVVFALTKQVRYTCRLSYCSAVSSFLRDRIEKGMKDERKA